MTGTVVVHSTERAIYIQIGVKQLHGTSILDDPERKDCISLPGSGYQGLLTPLNYSGE
jgi:hypothetical protein